MINFVDSGGWLLILSVWVIILSFSVNRVAARISTAALTLACATSLAGEAMFDRSVYIESVTANGLIFALAAFAARRYSLNCLSWVFVAATVSYYVIYIYASAGHYFGAGYYFMLIPIELLIVLFSVGAKCDRDRRRCSDGGLRGSVGDNFLTGGCEPK